MIILNTQGIVLKAVRYKENDVILTLFTRKLGKVSAIAKGAKRNKSSLLSSAQLFSYANYTLKRKGNMYTVNQSDTIKSFYDISYDIEAFSYATYITKLVEGSTCENQTNNRLFILLAQTLYLYTQENTDKKFITRAFELKFLDYIGFRPVVNRCSSCGSKSIKSAIFNIYEGGLLCDLCSENTEENIKLDEPMKKHISFRVGGPADILVKPRTEEQIAKVVKLLKEENVPYIVIGNGSNLLVKDGGVRGVVIEISDNFNDFNIDGNIVNIQSGALLSFVGKAVLRAELKGFEFAAGIPGTLGGALAMNAGAYGGEMKDIVKSVRLMDTDGNILDFTNEQMEFSYRRSILSRTDYIVLSAQIELENGSYDEIKATMADFTQRRVTKQPLSLPSAGSTFKRPEGHFAAKLIDDSGLRGLTLRGAQVSEKHCGFVVNLGNAKAKDILDLMYIVKSTVKAKYGITLEEEVKILGED